MNNYKSKTLYRRVVELDDYVYTLSLLKYPVSKGTFYYTMRIFQLKKCSDFLEQLEADTVTFEKSVFGKSCKKLPDMSEMVHRLESWFASDFIQQGLAFDP